MRRLLCIALAGAGLVSLQLYGLNAGTDVTTFELPLTALLLAAPYLRPADRIAATVGVALPLDAASVLPFGSYLLALSAVVAAATLVSRRFPIREHRALLIALVAGGAITTAFVLSGLAWTAHWLRLGAWTPLPNALVFGRVLAVLTVDCALTAAVTLTAAYLLRRRVISRPRYASR